MSELQDRVRTLVDYWLEHNREHEQEMRHWAERAEPLGEAVARALHRAALSLTQATASLEEAKEALKEDTK